MEMDKLPRDKASTTAVPRANARSKETHPNLGVCKGHSHNGASGNRSLGVRVIWLDSCSDLQLGMLELLKKSFKCCAGTIPWTI